MPFKKNRYFTGKLLTADDFEQEQRYFDDKRRLINRWVIGAGIAAGLEVIRVDDYNISVEMGLALDETGREILVETPVIRKLSGIDGFADATDREGAESLYLCIEYDQTPVEPVHNITNIEMHTKEEETFNKYKEGYRLFVTDEEPGSLSDFRFDADEDLAVDDAVRESAEQIQRKKYRQGIWLAKIELVKAGEFYMIEQVVPLPESPYIYSLPVARTLIRELKAEFHHLRGQLKSPDHRREEKTAAPADADKDDEWQFAQGTVRIPVPAGSQAGYCLFSQEIPHGLGLGDVEVILHIRQDGYGYSGAEAIFPDEDKAAEAAARIDFQRGTFIVGIRLLAETKNEEIQVGWTAIRKRSRNEIRPLEPRIYIEPALVNAKTRESLQLNAVCVNMDPADLQWSVAEAPGGTVDDEGRYQAPNVPGVYEVYCEKKGQRQTRATVFIVVRE